MKRFRTMLAGIASLALAGAVQAGSPCAGYSNCDDNQVNAQAQGQLQGQLQGQAQGQLQGQGQGQGQQQGNIGINKQNQNAYGGYAEGGKAFQGQLQGQIGINKNDNDNSNYSSNSNNNKAIAVQGQLQGNKQQAVNKVSIRSDASGNRVAAFAPSISSRSTTNCISTYSASGGSGGTGSVFSLGFSLPIRDEDCVMEQAVRTGFESNIPEAQELALDLYRHQMTTIAEREGHITAANVLDEEGNIKKVLYSQDLKAFVPVAKHPKYQRAAAIAFTEAMFKAGYKPNVGTVNSSGFQTVSFLMGGRDYTINMDEDLIESVIGDIDDDERQLKVERPDS